MNRPIRILLVEDNASDIELTRIGFEEGRIPVDLSVAHDGDEALKHLRQRATSGKDLPNIILLDLNMPKMNGIEFLERIKDFPLLNRIPIIILTSSHAEEDIRTAYEYYANCYVTKPDNLNDFISVARQVEEFVAERTLLPGDRDSNDV